MVDGKIQKKYLCVYPDCKKIYVTTDSLRKHCRKNHREWIKGKKPKEYSYIIPREYEGIDYTSDYMTMVRVILDTNIYPTPNTNQSTPSDATPTQTNYHFCGLIQLWPLPF